MDDFYFKKKFKWIPCNEFKNVKYIDKGGFGIVYKAIWLNNDGDEEVILKCHNDLSVNLNEFLNEYRIISGLKDIHHQNLIHCDFHDCNILNHDESKIYISDLGLCQPVKSFLKKYYIYGVMPFMAPEILRGKSYIPVNDMFNFSMIPWEFTSRIPPFNNIAHDLHLSLGICKGERPEIIENTPQCYVDLMKKCWYEDPLKRPSSKEVYDIIEKWIFFPYKKEIEEIDKELKCNVMSL
ncbi:kinase-like domain-containing protein [Rhizophagus diaphanus]|nr:kinase-like domain-containing protein [Rhizophagus diaphanus] [Rhizophagus sp. MUCL 43196]